MKRIAVVLGALLLPLAALAADSVSEAAKKAAQSDSVTAAPAGARVYFIEPKDGAELKGPVKVVFGLAPVMGVAPAGIQKDNTGHHHLLIDGPAFDAGKPLPATDQIRHFGNGQTEATVELKPGKHTLQLVLGDWKHQPHNPPVVSETITVTVK